MIGLGKNISLFHRYMDPQRLVFIHNISIKLPEDLLKIHLIGDNCILFLLTDLPWLYFRHRKIPYQL
jgi:hypothetical protein